MLMVIFGAGASYDSARPGLPAHLRYRPPLAKEIVETRDEFLQVATRYQPCRPIIDRLRSVMAAQPTAALEEELARLTEESRDYPERRGQLMAFRFYLRDIIAEATTNWRVQLIGFTQYLT